MEAVAAAGATAAGTVTGMGAQSYTETAPTTEITPGTAVITGLALPLMALMVRLMPATLTTHLQEPTRAGDRCLHLTGAQLPAKHITHEPEHLGPRISPRMPMGITETRKSQRTARLHIRSTKLLHRELQDPFKVQREPRARPRRALTATLRWAKPQAALSTPSQMAIPTRTPVADGSKRKEPQSPAPVIRALRKAIPLPQEVGGSRGRAAKDPLLPLAEVDGNPGRKVLEVRRAAVEEEVGAAVAAADAGKNPHSALFRQFQIRSAVS